MTPNTPATSTPKRKPYDFRRLVAAYAALHQLRLVRCGRILKGRGAVIHDAVNPKILARMGAGYTRPEDAAYHLERVIALYGIRPANPRATPRTVDYTNIHALRIERR